MTTPPDPDPIRRDELKQRAVVLKLHGLVAHWDEVPAAERPWVHRLIEWETVDHPGRPERRRQVDDRAEHRPPCRDAGP
jgi:hypothetical protein